MTENQAIKILKEEKSWESDSRKKEAFSIAVQSLEEIQKYREIGTVEELKEAKEKQIAKTVRFDRELFLHLCPSCNTSVDKGQNHCWNCGQRLYNDLGG